MDVTATLAREFERESHRIDQLIWDAMALQSGDAVLFFGFANNLEWIKRAVAIGASASVISDDADALRELRDFPVNTLRGSTSMLPARDDSFDVTVAFHYLHEVDPLFHANIISELARVGKRCVIVEPAPPSDPLGARIASLYSRAKRQLGEFENYYPIDYWRKLLAMAKPTVSCQTFTFLRTPPPQAVRGTVKLMIDTMTAEETPESYLTELRALAARPGAGLLPQARYVIVGLSPGVTAAARAGTDFRVDGPVSDASPSVKPFVPPALARPYAAGPVATGSSSTVYSSPHVEPEFPAVPPPPAPTAAPAFARNAPASPGASASTSPIARNAFGLPPAGTEKVAEAPNQGAVDADSAFGVPAPSGELPADFGWAWEPPG